MDPVIIQAHYEKNNIKKMIFFLRLILHKNKLEFIQKIMIIINKKIILFKT